MNPAALEFGPRYNTMTSLPKRMLYGSIGLMGLVAAAALIDVATGVLFQRQWVMDIIFLISSGLVIYLALDAIKDQK